MPLKKDALKKRAPSNRRVKPPRKRNETSKESVPTASSTVPSSPEQPTNQYGAAKRWTEKLVQGGFTPVSDYFLKNYSILVPPISNSEAMFIIHLMSFKWTSKAPRPSMRRIAERMGVSEVSVRNYARSLEDKNYLLRVMRVGRTNNFRLRPLFERLEAHQAAQVTKTSGEDLDEIED